MANLRNRLRSVDRADMALVVVLILVYAVTLWVHLDNREENLRPSVRIGTSDVSGISATPDLDIPKPEVAAQTTSDDGGREPEPSASVDMPPDQEEVPLPSAAEDAGTLYEQGDILQTLPETPAATQVDEGPDGDLSISGRVLDRSGSPVAGIRVVARAYNLFDRDSRRLIPVKGYQRETASGYDGKYAFEQLADGEYRLNTVATETHPQTQISVRAGVDFADIILTGQLELRVHGVITTADGDPLASVRVSPVVLDAPEVFSDKAGRYAFKVNVRDIVSSLTVRASKSGYEEQELKLKIASPDTDDLELDIVMQADEDSSLAEVRGVVRGAGIEELSSLIVRLSSAKLRKSHQAMTDAQGRFEMRGVQQGDDFMLSINAPPAYKDYFQRDIRIAQSTVTLNIELEAQDTGTLRGQMVNLFGTPVPNYTMVLKTKETSFYNQRLLGDGAGYFEVENAPAGELLLRTESTPYFTIGGILLSAGGTVTVPVVLDWGYDEIRGRIMDEDGLPVAVPTISLTWSHQQDGLHSTSRRTTAADESGNFHFTQLGPGVHRVTISVEGYKTMTLDHDVSLQGSALEVTLLPNE